jgi:hypothetical protein
LSLQARQIVWWLGNKLPYFENKVKDHHHHIRLYELEQSVVAEYNNGSGFVLTYTSM